jgi:hypothetical protein
MPDGEGLRRIHVLLPETLVDRIDEMVGKRERSRFIAEVLDGEVRRRRMRAALDELHGSLADVDIPGWETPEAASEWVRAGRRGELPAVSSDSAA